MYSCSLLKCAEINNVCPEIYIYQLNDRVLEGIVCPGSYLFFIVYKLHQNQKST